MHKESDREVKVRSVFLFAVLVTYCQNLSIKTKGGTNMIYGYARVSAKTQLKGNSLEEQRIELQRMGAKRLLKSSILAVRRQHCCKTGMVQEGHRR